MTPVYLPFGEAIKHIFDGKRMTATFLPENVYIQKVLAKEDNADLVKMLKITAKPSENKGEFKIIASEPWDMDGKAVMNNEWFISPFSKMNLE